MNSEFVWWQGRVEDVQDPLELGRCRVRILGYHSDNKSDIPTDTLPWAYPANPINSRPSETSLGPIDGSWVMGFFRDGKDAQEPVMTHSIDLGYKIEGDGNDKVDVGEINTHRLSRGDITGSYIEKESLDFDDKTKLSYDAKFPYNQVVESLSGHVFEVDDTPGNERLSKVHKSGTLEVIEANGTKIVKVIGDNYEMIAKDDNVIVEGNVNIMVNKGANITVGESANITSKGNLNLESENGFITMMSPLGVSVQAPFLGVSGALMHSAGPFVTPVPPPLVTVIRAADDAASLASLAAESVADVEFKKVTALEIKDKT